MRASQTRCTLDLVHLPLAKGFDEIIVKSVAELCNDN